MKNVALITELQGPELSPGDSLLLSPLQELGIKATAVPWDDPAVDWGAYDALVLRACWQYPEQPQRFQDWIAALETNKLLLWNEPPVVYWNMNKRYLQDLEARAVPIVPTVWLERGATPDLNDLLRDQGWEAAVVKPQISTSSDNTWAVRVPVSIHDQAAFEHLGRDRSLMVQKLMPGISKGEWSLIFIEEQFAHAVLKKPGEGQILVQEHRGGQTGAAIASPDLIDQAGNVVRLARKLTGSPLLYARVDGLALEDQLVLMELELIEPSLYMRHSPPTAALLAEAIAKRLV